MKSRTKILERATKVAEYIVEHRATVRQTAKAFGISKSTVHKDLTERVRYIDWKLYFQADQILKYNLSERAARGGRATRKKYKK